MTSARPAGQSPCPHMKGPISQTQDLATGHSGASVPSVISYQLPPGTLWKQGMGQGLALFFFIVVKYT